MKLKPITELFDPEDVGYWSSYRQLFDGLEIIVWEDVGSYQGDSFILLKDEGRWGYRSFGWGSCSMCDALQGCDTFEEVDDLRHSLINGIHWEDDAGQMLVWLLKHDWAGEWSWCYNGTPYFVQQCLDVLIANLLPDVEHKLEVEVTVREA